MHLVPSSDTFDLLQVKRVTNSIPCLELYKQEHVMPCSSTLSALTTVKMAPLHLSCTCHHHNASKVVQELGADETINYREQDFADIYKDKPFDYIFDSVGGEACFAVRMQHRVLAEM